MSSGTIKLKLRPTRIAFVVKPSDKSAIKQAIRLNSFLWGGSFNPIIPYYKRKPKNWGFETIKYKEILSGYLDAYDPDFIVPIGRGITLSNLDLKGKKVIKPDDILPRKDEGVTSPYGISIFEVSDYILDTEFKFERKEKIDVKFPRIGKDYEMFFASIFGQITPKKSLNKVFLKDFSKRMGAKEPLVSMDNYGDLMEPGKLNIRKFGRFYLQNFSNRGWKDNYIMLIDATKGLDVIDYWNMRALGNNIIPVAKQAIGNKAIQKMCTDFIQRNHKLINNNGVWSFTTLLKGRNTSDDEMSQFNETLKIKKTKVVKTPGNSPKVIQSWIPRVWSEFGRNADHVEYPEITADEAEYQISNQRSINVKAIDPKFAYPHSYGEARFVNRVSISYSSDTDIVAEVFPEGGRDLTKVIDSFGDTRFSRRGIHFYSHSTGSRIRVQIPTAEEVFLDWLKAKGYKAKLSSPGLIGNQIIKNLKGKWGLAVLSSRGLIELLMKMNQKQRVNEIIDTDEKSAGLEAKKFRGEIGKVAKKDFTGRTNNLLRRLIDLNMFRLGVSITCSICNQKSWFSLKDMDYELECPKCLSGFKMPSYSTNDIEWSYRTFGPFNLPYKAYGAYSVLLTLNFFMEPSLAGITPILSFELDDDDKEMEVDLGIFYQENRDDKASILIFAECKTNNDFEEKDVVKMEQLSQKFPGCTLVFATMKNSLSEKERKIIAPLIKKSHRLRYQYKKFSPVLILTGHELYTNRYMLDKVWNSLGEEYIKQAKSLKYDRELEKMIEATNKIHFNLSWNDFLNSKRAKNNKK